MTGSANAAILGEFFSRVWMAIQKIISFFLIFAVTAFLAGAAFADVYVYKDKNGVLTFTNTPNHAGYRRVLRESRGEGSGHASVNPSYNDLIQTASGRYNIDAELIRAVIKAESDFNARARSQKGAMGLMQLMPETARLHNISDAYDPSENVEGGVAPFKNAARSLSRGSRAFARRLQRRQRRRREAPRHSAVFGDPGIRAPRSAFL